MANATARANANANAHANASATPVTHATARIVVQATPLEKRTIASKAKALGMPVSELMRRGATAYLGDDSETELATLADAARDAADRSCAAIDDSLSFIAASNARIAKMERAA
jgi:hypothetical protein